MWDIMDLYEGMNDSYFKLMNIKQRILWNRKIRRLLDSQIGNPVLIENRECLGYWRNAISTSKSIEILLKSNVELKIISTQRKSMLGDIVFVWEKLVLDSDEVSATGGKPDEIDSLKLDKQK